MGRRKPHLITDRKKIMKLTNRVIPEVGYRKDGTAYPTKVRPICSECYNPVKKTYTIGGPNEKPRQVHVGYYCEEDRINFNRPISEVML